MFKVCVYFACLRTAEERGAVHPVAPAPYDIHEGRDVQQVTPPLTDTRTWRAISDLQDVGRESSRKK